MIVIECEQRTPEWKQARVGIITGSNADRLLTPAKQKTYALELLAEILTNAPTEVPVNGAMQWGIDNEKNAIAWYWWETDNKILDVGFCRSDCGQSFGASPDGLVGQDGLVEIKCPANTRIHLEHIESGPSDKYMAQIQWQLFVTGRKWADFVSYDPRVPVEFRGCIHRIERDESYIDKLKKGAQKVLEYIEKFKEKVKHNGK